MDFKMFAQFVMVAGLAVFGYGGYQKHAAEVKAEQTAKQSSQQMGFFGAVIAGMDAKASQENEEREANKLMAIGGGIIFFGFALSAAASKKKEAQAAAPKPAEDRSRAV